MCKEESGIGETRLRRPRQGEARQISRRFNVFGAIELVCFESVTVRREVTFRQCHSGMACTLSLKGPRRTISISSVRSADWISASVPSVPSRRNE